MKPTTTSRAVMPKCQSRRSAPQMRIASFQVLDKGGNTKSGIPIRPGKNSHPSRKAASTATLHSTVLARSDMK